MKSVLAVLFFVSLAVSALMLSSCGGKPAKAASVNGTASAGSAAAVKATLYSTAKGGLWMREDPDASGDKIVILPYRAEVKFFHATNDAVVIGGASGKWTLIEWRGSMGYAFGGFLTDVRPPEPSAVKADPDGPPYDPAFFRTLLDKTLYEDLPEDQQMDGFDCVIRSDGSFESEQLLGGCGSDKIRAIWSVMTADTDSFTLGIQGMLVRRVVAETETVTKTEFGQGVLQFTLSNGMYLMSVFEIPNSTFDGKRLKMSGK